MLDFLIIVGAIFLGAIVSIFINRILTTKKENKAQLSQDFKSELNNLSFEKAISLDALDKINHYFDEKKIDTYEKEKLLLKYSKLLQHYDEQIFKLQPIVEVQEIYEYRKQLYSLISDSIAKLDKRLSNFSNYIKNEENTNNDKKVVKIENNPDLHSIPISQKIINNSKLDESPHKYIDSLSPFDKSKEKGLNFVNVDVDDVSMTFSSVVKNIVDKNDKKVDNYEEDYKNNNTSNIKKDDFGDFNIDEINNIQQDILKILQRLDNTAVKV